MSHLLNRALLLLSLLVTASACAKSTIVDLVHPDGRRLRCSAPQRTASVDDDFRRCLDDAFRRGFRTVGPSSQRYWYQVGSRPCMVFDTAKACEDAVEKLRARVGREFVVGCSVRQGPRPTCPR